MLPKNAAAMKTQTWMESGCNWQSWYLTWSAINRTASTVASPPCFPSLINKDWIAPQQSFLPIHKYHLSTKVRAHSRGRGKREEKAMYPNIAKTRTHKVHYQNPRTEKMTILESIISQLQKEKSHFIAYMKKKKD